MLRKKGGCGAKFGDGDHSIEGQSSERVENPDAADLDNTILKMAKKRSLVDAAISLVRCSDMFTQDVDSDDFGGGSQNEQNAIKSTPKSTPRERATANLPTLAQFKRK